MLQDNAAIDMSRAQYDSPARQTPFAALFPSCPNSAATSQAAFSPAAEHDLFGSPAPSWQQGSSPMLKGKVYGSSAVREQSRFGMPKAFARITRLQEEHAKLSQQLKVCIVPVAKKWAKILV